MDEQDDEMAQKQDENELLQIKKFARRGALRQRCAFVIKEHKYFVNHINLLQLLLLSYV